jgi:hypothetical protein
MDNVGNHWRFIEDCAPAPLRWRLKRRLIRRCVYLVADRTALRHVALPLAWFVTGLYYVTKDDCVACKCDANLLCKSGLLTPWRQDGWYLLNMGFRGQIGDDQRLRRLYRKAWNPLTKLPRWINAKRYGQGQSDVRPTGRLRVPLPCSNGDQNGWTAGDPSASCKNGPCDGFYANDSDNTTNGSRPLTAGTSCSATVGRSSPGQSARTSQLSSWEPVL